MYQECCITAVCSPNIAWLVFKFSCGESYSVSPPCRRSPDVLTAETQEPWRKSVKRARTTDATDDDDSDVWKMQTDRGNDSETGMRVREESTRYSNSVSWLVTSLTGKVTCLRMSDQIAALVSCQALLHCQMVMRGWENCSSQMLVFCFCVFRIAIN